MIQCLHPSQRPILVAASDTLDAALARSAIEELGLIPVLVQDAAETIRQLSGGARRYSALVAGERVGEATGFTLCGVARDAGCRLPMLLLTSEVCRWTAVRAARLAVSVLWQPVPAYRLAQTLTVMLPPRPCAATPTVKLPEWSWDVCRVLQTGRRRVRSRRLGTADRPLAALSERMVALQARLACLRGSRFLYLSGHPRPFGGRPPPRARCPQVTKAEVCGPRHQLPSCFCSSFPP